MPIPVRPPHPETSVAVLFGFSRYRDHRHLPGLPAVERSVHDLAAVLTHPVTGGFAVDRCLVQTEDTSVEDFGVRFEQAANRAEDVLLVYYCGHGILDTSPYTGRLYLAFPRTSKDYFNFTALPLREVKRVIAGSPARNKILILDCCYSGQAHTHTQAGSADLQDQLEIDGTYTLSSASGYDFAIAPPGAQYTAFTGALLTVLDVGITRPDPMPIREIFTQVSALMRPHGLSSPSQSSTNTADQLALVRPRQPRPKQPRRVQVQPHGAADGRPESPARRPVEQIPPRLVLPDRNTWADHAAIDLVRHHLLDPVRAIDVDQRINELADRLHTALTAEGESPAVDPADPDPDAALARRLEGYERATGPMLRTLVVGARYGESRHDKIWLRALHRVLNHRYTPPATIRDSFASAERYPALLLVTALGAAAVAADRHDLAYRTLAEVAHISPNGRSIPALLVLTPLRVIAPDVAASLPGWEHELADLAVSAHLRHHLREAFVGILDDGDYTDSFDAYEYLRSLLEFDAAGFSSLGLFAEAGNGTRTGRTREFYTHLTGHSRMLEAGAFGGDVRRAERARRRIEASLSHGAGPG
jgi:hypothetical protein